MTEPAVQKACKPAQVQLVPEQREGAKEEVVPEEAGPALQQMGCLLLKPQLETGASLS